MRFQHSIESLIETVVIGRSHGIFVLDRVADLALGGHVLFGDDLPDGASAVGQDDVHDDSLAISASAVPGLRWSTT